MDTIYYYCIVYIHCVLKKRVNFETV